jgi:hypothetical protein
MWRACPSQLWVMPAWTACGGCWGRQAPSRGGPAISSLQISERSLSCEWPACLPACLPACCAPDLLGLLGVAGLSGHAAEGSVPALHCSQCLLCIQSTTSLACSLPCPVPPTLPILQVCSRHCLPEEGAGDARSSPASRGHPGSETGRPGAAPAGRHACRGGCLGRQGAAAPRGAGAGRRLGGSAASRGTHAAPAAAAAAQRRHSPRRWRAGGSARSCCLRCRRQHPGAAGSA